MHIGTDQVSNFHFDPKLNFEDFEYFLQFESFLVTLSSFLGLFYANNCIKIQKSQSQEQFK